MTEFDFRQWLDRYGDAWIAGDPEAAVALFSNDAAYFETPFDAPLRGSEAIRRYWTEGARDGQSAVTFEAVVVAFDGRTGLAHWRASFRRVPSGSFVELDGVLSASFGADARCVEFREWWHRRETSGPA